MNIAEIRGKIREASIEVKRTRVAYENILERSKELQNDTQRRRAAFAQAQKELDKWIEELRNAV